MQFMVLMAETDPDAWERAGDEEREAVFAAHRAFDEAVRERGRIDAGEALQGVATARTLRPGPDSARTVTDGPYADVPEQLGGFYLIDVADLDEAVELCRLLPHGYTIEVRPTLRIEGYDSDV